MTELGSPVHGPGPYCTTYCSWIILERLINYNNNNDKINNFKEMSLHYSHFILAKFSQKEVKWFSKNHMANWGRKSWFINTLCSAPFQKTSLQKTLFLKNIYLENNLPPKASFINFPALRAQLSLVTHRTRDNKKMQVKNFMVHYFTYNRIVGEKVWLSTIWASFLKTPAIIFILLVIVEQVHGSAGSHTVLKTLQSDDLLLENETPFLIKPVLFRASCWGMGCMEKLSYLLLSSFCTKKNQSLSLCTLLKKVKQCLFKS